MDKVDLGSHTAIYGGSGAGLYFGLFSVNELAAITGALVAVIGLVVQVWYVVQKNTRAKELHKAELAQLTGGTNSAK